MPIEPQVDAITAAEAVAAALDALEIPYLIGGSMASSSWGTPRSTNDVDFAVQMTEAQVAPFAARLGEDFDVDQEALRDAIRSKASWNIFFLPLFIKIDLFVFAGSPFERSEFARRRPHRLVGGTRDVWLPSPEDVLLRKLLWFDSGGRVSELQWRDIIGLIRGASRGLDRDYLDGWARGLGIASLVDEAFAAAVFPDG